MQRHIRQTVLILLPLILALGTVRAYAFPAWHTWHVLGPAGTLPSFFLPSGVAVGPSGNLYVLDSGNFRVIVLSPQGRMIRHFGARGSGPGQLGAYRVSYDFPRMGAGVEAGPSSLAIDRRGTVYVADWPNRRIEKFSSRGAFLAAWAVLSGSDVRRIAVAVGPSGNVVDVAAVYAGCPDSCTSREVLERRSPNGTVLARWESAPAQEDVASLGLAVGPDGAMWVGLRGTELCYKSCPSFAFLDKYAWTGHRAHRWGGYSMSAIPFAPSEVAIGGRGAVFLADQRAHRIEKRSPQMALLGRWGAFLLSQFAPYTDSPGGVAVDARGQVYATDTGTGVVQRFSTGGKLTAEWGAAGHAPGRLWLPGGIAADGFGGVWVMDTGNSRVQHLSGEGRVLAHWHVDAPNTAIALGPDRSVYVAQTLNHRISIARFSPSGALRARLGGGMGISDPPSGMVVGPNGNLYLLAYFFFSQGSQVSPDDGQHILVLSPAGRKLAFIKTSFRLANSGIAVDRAGNIYGFDAAKGNIVKLSPNGTVLAHLGAPGSIPGSFRESTGIAVDAGGDILVADTRNNRIVRLSPAGEPRTPSLGGQFRAPTGVSVDAGGDIFVLDTGQNRIQSLTS